MLVHSVIAAYFQLLEDSYPINAGIKSLNILYAFTSYIRGYYWIYSRYRAKFYIHFCKYFMLFTEWYVNCHLKDYCKHQAIMRFKSNIYIIKTNSISLDQSLSNGYWPSYCNLFRVSQANLSTLSSYFLFLYQSLLVCSCIQLYCY